MARVFHEIGINETSDLVNALAKASRRVAENASATEDRAKRYLKDVKGFVKTIEGLYRYLYYQSIAPASSLL